MANRRKYLFKDDFDNFLNNDWKHLKEKVSCLEKATHFIKGQLWFVFPVLAIILTAIVALVFK